MANRSNLGMILRQLEQFDAAQTHLDTALGYYRATGSLTGQMSILDELSQLYAQRSEWSPAVSTAAEALGIAGKLADQRSEAGVLNTRGFALLGTRAVTDARNHFESSRLLSRRHGYRYFEAQALLLRLDRVPTRLTRDTFRLLGSAAGRRLGLPLSGVATDLAYSVGAPAQLGFLAAHAGASGATLRSLLRRPERSTRSPAPTSSLGSTPAPSSDALLEQSRSAVFWSFLVDTVITKLDRSTMAYGLEARSPFLDDDVVALGLALPPAESGAGGTGKVPVRSLAAQLCGPSASTRTKQGFRGPMGAVLRGPLQELVRDVLDERVLRDSVVWDARAVTRIVDQHMSGARVWTQVLWSILVLESWLVRVQRTPEEARP
jgi:hypothetical protein